MKRRIEERYSANHEFARWLANKGRMNGHTQNRMSTPQKETNAEVYYYQKQIHNKTPMVVCLEDGQQLRGIITGYDKDSIKMDRKAEPSLLVFKRCIRYMYKQDEEKSKQ
jgi:sRNA-binding regulator protein Hfq